MAEVSNRGLAFGAASAALGVVLAFASSSEAAHRKGCDDAVRCAGTPSAISESVAVTDLKTAWKVDDGDTGAQRPDSGP